MESKKTFYTVSTTSKVDYDFSVTCTKHGAFTSFAAAVERLKQVVEKFKEEHKKELEKYSDENAYPVPGDNDEYNGSLIITEEFALGYWCCTFGCDEHYEEHQICVDEWEIEE